MVLEVCSYRHSFWSKNRKKEKKTGVYPCRIGCRALVWAKAFLFYLYMTTFDIFFRPTDAALWHWFKFTWRLFLEENSSVPALRNGQHQQIRKFQAQGFKLIGNLRRPVLDSDSWIELFFGRVYFMIQVAYLVSMSSFTFLFCSIFFFSKLVVWLHFLPGNFICFVPCTPCCGITAVPWHHEVLESWRSPELWNVLCVTHI